MDGDDPILKFSPENLNKHIAINTSSAIVAMAESIRAFRSLPAEASKTFIYTGNCLNVKIVSPPALFSSPFPVSSPFPFHPTTPHTL